MNTAATSQGQLFALGPSRKYRTAPADKNQQFSPRWVADFARTVFDSPIELDPTSSPIANETIAAAKIYTIEDDALIQSWAARTLFFNPPYGTGLIGPMIAKFLEELPGIDQAIVLVNSSTCAKWYQALLQHCDRFLLPHTRISFWTAEGCPEDEPDRAEYQANPPGGNRYDQTLFYFGANTKAFEQHGASIGLVSTPSPKSFGCAANSRPTFIDQAIAEIETTIAALQEEGVLGPCEWPISESRDGKIYHRMRWNSGNGIRSHAITPGDYAKAIADQVRRDRVAELRQAIGHLEQAKSISEKL